MIVFLLQFFFFTAVFSRVRVRIYISFYSVMLRLHDCALLHARGRRDSSAASCSRDTSMLPLKQIRKHTSIYMLCTQRVTGCVLYTCVYCNVFFVLPHPYVTTHANFLTRPRRGLILVLFGVAPTSTLVRSGCHLSVLCHYLYMSCARLECA